MPAVAATPTCSKCGQPRPAAKECPPCHRRRVADWKQANLDRVKAQKHRNEPARRRRAWAREAERRRLRYRERTAFYRAGDVTADQLRAIHVAAGGACHYCRREVKARFKPTDPRGFDHVVPKADGGRHTAANLRLCCRDCNSRLSDKKASAA